MSDFPKEPDQNEHEIDPPPTAEERELARRAVEYARHLERQKQSEAG